VVSAAFKAGTERRKTMDIIPYVYYHLIDVVRAGKNHYDPYFAEYTSGKNGIQVVLVFSAVAMADRIVGSTRPAFPLKPKKWMRLFDLPYCAGAASELWAS